MSPSALTFGIIGGCESKQMKYKQLQVSGVSSIILRSMRPPQNSNYHSSAIIHIVPVEVLEPSVPSNVLGAVFHVAQTLRSVGHQQLLHQILGDRIHETRPFVFAVQDFLINAERVVRIEWRVSDQHFVDQYAYGTTNSNKIVL